MGSSIQASNECSTGPLRVRELALALPRPAHVLSVPSPTRSRIWRYPSRMARAIIRYSASTGGPGNELRGAIREALEAAGFVKRGTALWDISDTSTAAITKAIEQTSRAIRKSAPDTLDHLWIYVDTTG